MLTLDEVEVYYLVTFYYHLRRIKSADSGGLCFTQQDMEKVFVYGISSMLHTFWSGVLSTT